MDLKFIVLGKSDATIAYIMEILEGVDKKVHLEIVNNIDVPIQHPFDRPGFEYEIVKTISDERFPCIVGVTNPSTKIKLLQNYDTDKLNFIRLKHQSAIVSSVSTIGKGVMIGAFVSVMAYTEIGNFVTISTKATVGHHVKLEDYVTLNPGCIVSGHSVIGRGTSIGAGAVISDHVTIGENVIIGAGAVVVRDIPSNVIAYGNPCKPKRENG